MKKRKRKSKVLTFTIVSNDVNQRVTRFRIPTFAIYLLATVPVLSFGFLFYYIHAYNVHKEQIAGLSDQLQTTVQEKDHLSLVLEALEEENGKTVEQLEELIKLEEQVRTYLEELPTIIEPQGGEHIPLKEGHEAYIESAVQQSSILIERYKSLLEVVDAVSQELKYIPTAWPTEPDSITSAFGMRRDPFTYSTSFHGGVDIRGNYGTPVYAAADGTVTMAQYYGSYGKTIIIKHSDTYETLYGHLATYKVKPGDKVKKGDLIGTMGSTGRSTGPHLHYEIISNGEPIDPEPFLQFFKE